MPRQMVKCAALAVGGIVGGVRSEDGPLVRAGEVAKQNQLPTRHRLSKFLLRTGQRPAAGVKAWTLPYMAWARQLRFPQVAQESTQAGLSA